MSTLIIPPAVDPGQLEPYLRYLLSQPRPARSGKAILLPDSDEYRDTLRRVIEQVALNCCWYDFDGGLFPRVEAYRRELSRREATRITAPMPASGAYFEGWQNWRLCYLRDWDNCICEGKCDALRKKQRGYAAFRRICLPLQCPGCLLRDQRTFTGQPFHLNQGPLIWFAGYASAGKVAVFDGVPPFQSLRRIPVEELPRLAKHPAYEPLGAFLVALYEVAHSLEHPVELNTKDILAALQSRSVSLQTIPADWKEPMAPGPIPPEVDWDYLSPLERDLAPLSPALTGPLRGSHQEISQSPYRFVTDLLLALNTDQEPHVILTHHEIRIDQGSFLQHMNRKPIIALGPSVEMVAEIERCGYHIVEDFSVPEEPTRTRDYGDKIEGPLRRLWERGEFPSQQELATVAKVDEATVSRWVKKIEADGSVQRRKQGKTYRIHPAGASVAQP